MGVNDKLITIHENGINLVIEISDSLNVRLLHFSSLPYNESFVKEDAKDRFRLVELQITGEDQDDHHGSKHTGTMPGGCLKYVGHLETINNIGKKLEIVTENNGIEVTSHFQFHSDISIAQCWTTITNKSDEAKGIEYVSSFVLFGLVKEGVTPWDKKSKIYIPHNYWAGEVQWKDYTLPELGYSQVWDWTSKRIYAGSTGTWSTSEYLPMGYFENTECGNGLFWQIEHNGSWHWELCDISKELYLQVSGPTENENGWWKSLKPGQSFETVPVAVGVTIDGFVGAMKQLTLYRRRIRRPNTDNIRLPVIFNDYMNCLFGDQTTEKLIPLIDAAAEAGCEYFCMDCGWYSDGDWWNGVGEWLPSQKRFPGGIREPLDYITSKGMIPGLWLEIEVMGIKCPLASELPDDWFFVKHGKRVIDHGRYQLDFRNPEVRKHADKIIDRLVTQYGVGYIKMDYNINIGLGTELSADSLGDGLLEHNRAYLEWLDGIFERYPELVIENCGSGGMRMDYALLKRHSIQSSSDQMDYRKFAVISAASPTAVTPEQCAAWSYPLKEGDREEVIFNMVNAMLVRIHQSGHLADISPERFALVKEGIDYYKQIRDDIRNGLPFWPIGLPTFSSQWASLGIECGNKAYLAVWRFESESDTCVLDMSGLKDMVTGVKYAYPKEENCSFNWTGETRKLSVKLTKPFSARIFEFELEVKNKTTFHDK